MVCWPRTPQYCLLAAQGRFRTGGSLAATTPDSCCDGRGAGRNRAFRFRALSHIRPGARPVRRLRGVEPRGPGLAGCAVEGRAPARRLHLGKAARRRVVAGRSGRKCRRQIAQAVRRAALFLVRRGHRARRREMAGASCLAGLRQCCPRSCGARRSAAAAASCGRKRLAGAQCLGSRHGEPVLRLGREIVRRAARRRAVMAGAA